MNKMEGKEVLVIGFAESGYASSIKARELGANVTIIDSSLHPVREDSARELEEKGISTVFGVGVPEDLPRYDLIITSPGVPDHADIIVKARKEKKKIISELEFGYRLLDNKIVAVTGTNGKTTTTRLISWILDSGIRHAVPCGNIGKPLVSLYGQVGDDDLLIIEVSSFQLRNIEDFRADVSVVLNIAPDHFDWHSDFDDYKKAKLRLVENMKESDFLVYNADDEFCVEMADMAVGRTIGFSLLDSTNKGIWVEDGWVMAGEPFNIGRLVPIDEIKLRGVHNLANLCAAAGASLCMEEKPERIREAAGSFKPLEHRMELAGKIGGVSFFNDSKATNPHATVHSIKSFTGPLVVILGGRNKGLDFGELALDIGKRLYEGAIKGIVLLGESTGELRSALLRVGGDEIDKHVITADSLDDSVSKALAIADGEGAVLFSPACASFDMFKDYKDRGRAFKKSVHLLEGRG